MTCRYIPWQGDEEKKLKLPVSPGFEREGHSKVNSQLGFIKFMVKPLYDAMDLLVRRDGYMRRGAARG